MREYTFDVKLFAVLDVKANNRAEALALLKARLGMASITVGDNGDGRITESSLTPDGEHDLIEIDGEPV